MDEYSFENSAKIRFDAMKEESKTSGEMTSLFTDRGDANK